MIMQSRELWSLHISVGWMVERDFTLCKMSLVSSGLSQDKDFCSMHFLLV